MTKAVTKTSTSFSKVSINSPQAMANFATTLKKFIVERELYSDIKGKNFVNVEGWEFAGACMGIASIVRSCEQVESDREIKYKARVELVLIASQKVIGAGEAICSNKEKTKNSFDEYAIMSMAQTRAVSKAYRNQFGWLMKMAGYEATTAEEMESASDTPYEQEYVEPVPLTDDEKQTVLQKLLKLPVDSKLRATKAVFNSVVLPKPEGITDMQWRDIADQVEHYENQKQITE